MSTHCSYCGARDGGHTLACSALQGEGLRVQQFRSSLVLRQRVTNKGADVIHVNFDLKPNEFLEIRRGEVGEDS